VVIAVDGDARFVEQGGAFLGHMREAAGRFEVCELFVGEREHDAAKAGPFDRAGAHAAGLAAGVHGGGSRGGGVEFAGRPSGQLQLRVGGNVMVGEDRVVVFGEHAAVRADQQRSERRVPGRPPGGGKLDSPASASHAISG